MVKIEERIFKKKKIHPSKLIKPFIPLARREMDELDVLEYTDHMYTTQDTASGKYVPRYVRTYHRSMHHSQGTSKASKTEKEQIF